MSKKMTPCEKLGYKVGDKFKVVDGTGVHYAVGSFITLIHDDGSSCPRFNGVHAIYESGDSFFPLDFVEKVVVNNETERKVEAEMTSDKEITIKVSDWHKNGELPPVGEVCIFDPAGGECYFNDDELKAKGHNVYIIAHTNYKKTSGSVAVFKWDLDDCCGVSSANACSFRPLRTERDKAIDEMMSVAAENWGNLQDCCERLYEYGYRKEVK